MPREPLVIAENLAKVYRDGTRAVEGVSFSVNRGVHILMGPNGSGKTTTLGMIAGALPPTKGQVKICGMPLWPRGKSRARECIGYAPQHMPFRENLKTIENLIWYGLLRGLSIRESKQRAKNLLELVGLAHARDKKITELSGGMRRRLAIAAALIGNPQVIILDEPTSGLDPSARKNLWQLIKSLTRERCVLASTHIAEDAEEYADTVLVFHQGRLVAHDTPMELVRRYAPWSIIVVRGRFEKAPSIEGAELVHLEMGEARYKARDPDTLLPRLIQVFIKEGFRIESVRVRRPGLSEVYYVLTGASLEEVSS